MVVPIHSWKWCGQQLRFIKARLRGPTLREFRRVPINGAYDSAQYITPIPEHYVRYVGRGDDRLAVVTGIDELFDKACAERKLLSELNVYWARRTWRVSVEDYRSFNPFRRPHTIQ